MPVMGNIGNLQYVILAILGGALAIGGFGGLTFGYNSFFPSVKQKFYKPISQISSSLTP